MNRDRPAWRRLFDHFDETVGGPLETGANSDEFMRALLIVARVRRAVGSRVDGAAAWALHQARLPAHTDVRALQRQLGELQRQVARLERAQNQAKSRDPQ